MSVGHKFESGEEFEQKRLDALCNYDVLDKDPQVEFDRITELASRICKTPIALISLIDSDRQWFLSNVGLDATETARDIAFCEHAIKQSDIFEVKDATQDDRFSSNPLVVSDPAIRFYAGAPLVTPEGYAIGTLCAIDTKPSELDDTQKAALEALSLQIMTQLELQKSNQLLKDANELQRLINENNSSPIFVKDDEFKIVYANNAFKFLYPEERRDFLIGRTTFEQYSEKDCHGFLVEDRKALNDGSSIKVEQLTVPNGNLVTLKTVKKRFLDGVGNRFILGISDDVTEREALISKLLWLNQDYQKFTENVESELRSPIAAIENITRWLREDLRDKLSQEDAENFALLESRIHRMQSLLEAIDRYRNIIHLDKRLDVVSAGDVESLLIETLDGRGVGSVKFIEKDVRLPRQRFNMALKELINNSIEHNQGKDINVSVLVSGNDDFNTVTVKDDGVGIPAEFLSKVFNFGETLRSKDEHESNGIGLTLVKQLVEQCDGEVSADSHSQQGVTFILTWPKNSVSKYD